MRMEMISTSLRLGCISRSFQITRALICLLVDVLLGDADTKFFTAVECNFLTKDDKDDLASRTKPEVLVKKFCDALEEYPCLVGALLENRFCFVFASFQAFSGKETVESIAEMILSELKEKKKGRTENDSIARIRKNYLVGSLIILRRKHLEALLTPTLKDRYHFFKSGVSESD